ncbi:azurin [Winogradskyella sp. PG-2]|uniref:azurin n=1 Tax=Winogradskyella sp. PG-2 TaxID=754409 RepID=UPI00045873E7|nr:azurin [Winogradskyella sp. PG-2]BAO76124.1 azurin [Winogradskyella sp. PG-2]
MKKYLNLSILVLTITSFTLFNCGGKEEEKEEKTTYDFKKDKSTKKDTNLAILGIIGDDNMQFNKKELRVKAGQRVKLTLKHNGKIDVNIMGHNVVILKKGTDKAAFAAKAAIAKDNGYIPEGTDEVIAHTKMIGGGQITTIEFDVPEVGEYDFICSFPAHFALMQGKFIVE